MNFGITPEPNPILKGKKIAILATDGFEQIELTDPRKALQKAGAEVVLIGPSPGKIRGWKYTKWGTKYAVEKTVEEANPGDFDGLLLPGGVLNPDKLRMNSKAVEFVKAFFQAKKPVAAICHGPQTLIEAGVVRGRRLTSYPSIKTDLINAGAEWVDEEVVVDNGLVTSRKPDDLPAFNKKMIEEFAEGKHAGQTAAQEQAA
jgi:protease I